MHFAATALAALMMSVPTATSDQTADATQVNCDGGAVAECRSLAEQFFEGRGRPRSFVRASELYGKGCARGDAKSCLRLAEMIALRQGVAKGAPLPPLYEKACAGGEMLACLRLGASFMPSEREPGVGEVRDLDRALTLFEKACAAGTLEACTTLGGMYAEGSRVAKDPTRAHRYLEKACAGGETGACWRLGAAYEKGTDVARDEARAAGLYARVMEIRRRSCAAGDAVDCLRLGGSLQTGHLGVPKDPEQAARVLQRSCDLGEPYGCRDLGMMYDGTRGGLHRDLERAKALRQREAGIRESLCSAGDFNQCQQANTAKADYVACSGGDPDGCFRVAKLYLYGEVKDAIRAAHFFAKGCDAGDAGLCQEAAELYATGQSARSGIALPAAQGLPDLPRAVALYQKGCDLGGAEACIALKRMMEKR